MRNGTSDPERQREQRRGCGESLPRWTAWKTPSRGEILQGCLHPAGLRAALPWDSSGHSLACPKNQGESPPPSWGGEGKGKKNKGRGKGRREREKGKCQQGKGRRKEVDKRLILWVTDIFPCIFQPLGSPFPAMLYPAEDTAAPVPAPARGRTPCPVCSILCQPEENASWGNIPAPPLAELSAPGGFVPQERSWALLLP